MDPHVHQTTCEYGPDNAKHTAVILGDSYALAVYPMVINALGLTDWKVIGLNQRECMIADITPWPWTGTGADLTCPDHRAWVNSYIARLKPDLVVLSDQPFHPIADGNQDSGDQHNRIWADGLDSALATLRPLAKKIVYFGVPTSQQALTDCVLAGGVMTRPCTGSSDWLAFYLSSQANLAERYGIPFIDANEWLCVGGKCPGIIDKTPVYWDGAHFTQDFSAKLGPLFRAFLIANKLI
jgi:lysophospholipase L1-like esterase